MADAVLTGVETRTSSPIRILRGTDFQSVNLHRSLPGRRRLWLCGRHPFFRRGWHQGRGSSGTQYRESPRTEVILLQILR